MITGSKNHFISFSANGVSGDRNDAAPWDNWSTVSYKVKHTYTI